MRRKTPLAFDIDAFNLDVIRACNRAGISRRKLSLETGVKTDVIYRMTGGYAPTARDLSALCKWAGLDVALYSIES